MEGNHKNAVITGASRGIGKAIVEKFASEGVNVWACASRRNEAMEQEWKHLAETYSVWIRPVYFNLEQEEEIAQAVKRIRSDKETVDILVNCAGVPYGGLAQMTPLSDLRRVMEINFIAQISLIQKISKLMMRQKNGNIINIGSVGGIEAREGYLAYGASKAAFLWSTRLLSKELARYGIRVNAVAPGLIETDMGNYKTEEEKNKVLSGISMQRMGIPEEVACAVWFLASEESSFITGSTLNVDGGRLM
ncbi:SDR family NAD(P)-dependent oxidoreductase [Hominifimenecus sp. rT4P-3]|uniref:SDR family NAD(P)-dependent oxidoreductase n=1 Tax=Hominifimenecus sp. rT4P-3 TaxID=3242979 RepID=UPI003DA235E5